ncbi:hypothetical protein MIND_01214100 [Mycena indigotica]|uniref:Uncharacterized protein n=1 Tax=Mycena indigotica TaxID=2126181 RepID=A0A8H6VVR2_9AGAR|nr:uncharacterized protein MIND_01214100 [Mycena indigotica]KAF7291888.1 hypothetical protein MIND_01214100 [Mycena indigotica]
MSIASPTVLPRHARFPVLLPDLPHPYPIPPQNQGRSYGRLKAMRNLQREMDDLSDEENEVEEMNSNVRHRGFGTLIPIGRTLTQQEEKNDAEDEESDSESGQSNGPPSVGEDIAENSTQDLDASMEDLDEDGDDDQDSDDDDDEPEEGSSEL